MDNIILIELTDLKSKLRKAQEINHPVLIEVLTNMVKEKEEQLKEQENKNIDKLYQDLLNYKDDIIDKIMSRDFKVLKADYFL